MKNLLLIASMFFAFTFAATAQIQFGAGLTFQEELGVQVRARADVGSFDIIPKFSYYFIDNVSQVSFDIDAAYNVLNIGDENPLYVFGGPTLYRASFAGISRTNIGINLGVGIEISHFYGEVRYTALICEECGGDIGFAAGYYF